MAILTLADFKTYAGINSPNDDTKHQLFVDSANKYVESYCNRKFADTNETDRITYEGEDVIILPHVPINSFTSITTVSTGATIPSSAYIVDAKKGYIHILEPNLFSKTKFDTMLVYSHGMITPPEDLKLATYEIATYYLKREFNSNKRAANESMDTPAMPVSQLIPPHIRTILENYRVYA